MEVGQRRWILQWIVFRDLVVIAQSLNLCIEKKNVFQALEVTVQPLNLCIKNIYCKLCGNHNLYNSEKIISLYETVVSWNTHVIISPSPQQKFYVKLYLTTTWQPLSSLTFPNILIIIIHFTLAAAYCTRVITCPPRNIMPNQLAIQIRYRSSNG